MSANRNGRQRGMRRAYLKAYSCGYIPTPKTANPEVMQGYKDHVSDPTISLPHTTRRRRLPIVDDPFLMVAVTRERLRNPPITVSYVRLVDTPLVVWWRCFTGYEPSATNWLVKYDPRSKVIERSFTWAGAVRAMRAWRINKVPMQTTQHIGDNQDDIEQFVSAYPMPC